MRIGLFGLGMGLLLWPSAAFGQLAFEKTVLDVKVDPSEEQLEVKYPYENGTGDTVSIVKIETSCGCLQASTDVNDVAPGEKGTITGVFSVGARTGAFEKVLTVQTASGGKPGSQELRVRIDVPAIVELSPTLVSWEVGEALTPKAFVLKVLRDKPIRVTEANSSRDGFECEIQEIAEGKLYRVVVKPPSTTVPLMGIVRVETDCELTKHRRHLAFFSVKGAASDGAGK